MNDILVMLVAASMGINIILWWAMNEQRKFYEQRLEFWFSEACRWQRKSMTRKSSKDEKDTANWWKE